MHAPLDPSRPDTLARLAAALGEPRVTLAGDGMSAIVLRTEAGEIVRIPRSPRAAAGHVRLACALPALAPHLPVAIPVPTRILPSSAALPHGALVSRMLPGVVATAGAITPAIVRQLAGILVALHAAPLPDGDMPRHIDDSRWRALWEVVRPACAAHLTVAEVRALDAWWVRFLAAPERHAFTPAPCHGDVWHENLLLDAAGKRITALLDWETLNLGDPAQDLAYIRHAGDTAADALLRDYVALSPRADPLLAARVRWYWEARELDELRTAVEQDDTVELADAIDKLRRGPILQRERSA